MQTQMQIRGNNLIYSKTVKKKKKNAAEPEHQTTKLIKQKLKNKQT